MYYLAGDKRPRAEFEDGDTYRTERYNCQNGVPFAASTVEIIDHRIDFFESNGFDVLLDTSTATSAYSSTLPDAQSPYHFSADGFPVPQETILEQPTLIPPEIIGGENTGCSYEGDCLDPTSKSLPLIGLLTSDTHEMQSEVCFGALIETVKVSDSQQEDYSDTYIDLRPCGKFTSLYSGNTGKYIGILNNEAFGKVLGVHNIRISAKLVPLECKSTKGAAKTRHKDRPSRAHQLRAIVYGRLDEKDVIADLLSGAGLFLQQPFLDECDRDTVYDNPHYLVRPGSKMPLLSSSSDNLDEDNKTGSEPLQEAKKNRFMQMFDSTGDAHATYVSASPRMAAVLKEHQQTAVAFMMEKECGCIENPRFPPMWTRVDVAKDRPKYRNTVTGTYQERPRPARGGILADEMGLGKSLTILALVCNSLDAMRDMKAELASCAENQSLTTLIVTPKSTIPGWLHQINRHIHPGQLRVSVYHGPERQLSADTISASDILITTYETLRSEWETEGPLVSKRWYRVVLDEAHRIRSRSSQIFSATCALRAVYRWCLTGTPIHNSLDDLGALLSFLGVEPFISKAPFVFWISSALNKNNAEGMKRLHKLIKATCLRRTKSMVSSTCQLPKRTEEDRFVTLSPADRDLYEFFRSETAKIASGKMRSGVSGRKGKEEQTQSNIIALINVLRLVCDHGEKLLPATAMKLWQDRSTARLSWQSVRNITTSCQLCGLDISCADSLSGADTMMTDNPDICRHCTNGEADSAESVLPTGSGSCLSSLSDNIGEVPPVTLYQSSSMKIQALLQNLTNSKQASVLENLLRPEKSVVFSFWTKMLDLIQQALQIRGFKFQRIDGQSTLEARIQAISVFDNDPDCTIMLASIGSTGEGVDLKVANVVHIIEPQWNPMVEAQAVDRVHRIGQDRDVKIIRYIVEDSIETYVRWLQLDKIKLINQSMETVTTQEQQVIDETRWNKLRSALQCSQAVET